MPVKQVERQIMNPPEGRAARAVEQLHHPLQRREITAARPTGIDAASQETDDHHRIGKAQQEHAGIEDQRQYLWSARQKCERDPRRNEAGAAGSLAPRR
jgi:hypothetical protein